MARGVFCKVLLVVVAVFGLLVFSGILLAQGRSEDAHARVKEVRERHSDQLMAKEGVVGTAVGRDDSDRPVVKVFTERPGIGGIPKELEGIPVDVEVTGRIYALTPPQGNGKVGGSPTIDPTAWFPRPVPIGVSTGHPDITAGTIGCRVKDFIGRVFALSNNHIYANENNATMRDPVLQPGPYDGGGTVAGREDVIGTLYTFERIRFGIPEFNWWPTNRIDAAIALSSTDNLGNATPSDGYGIPKSTTVDAQVGQMVQKYGRTTGLTRGIVYAVNATIDVYYSSGVARFVDQIIIVPGSFSAGGDSGSLVVLQQRGSEDDRKPVGLLFAGSSTITVANPIDAVLSRFLVTVDGE